LPRLHIPYAVSVEVKAQILEVLGEGLQGENAAIRILARGIDCKHAYVCADIEDDVAGFGRIEAGSRVAFFYPRFHEYRYEPVPAFRMLKPEPIPESR
jgi:hypothetical protein